MLRNVLADSGVTRCAKANCVYLSLSRIALVNHVPIRFLANIWTPDRRNERISYEHTVRGVLRGADDPKNRLSFLSPAYPRGILIDPPEHALEMESDRLKARNDGAIV